MQYYLTNVLNLENDECSSSQLLCFLLADVVSSVKSKKTSVVGGLFFKI